MRADRTVPVGKLAGSRDLGASPSTLYPAAEIIQAPYLPQHLSADIRRIVWFGPERAERIGNRQARIRNPLALEGFSPVLAMEFKIAWQPSEVVGSNQEASMVGAH